MTGGTCGWTIVWHMHADSGRRRQDKVLVAAPVPAKVAEIPVSQNGQKLEANPPVQNLWVRGSTQKLPASSKLLDVRPDQELPAGLVPLAHAHKLRCLHYVGRCWRVPGRDFKNWQFHWQQQPD